MEKKKKKKPPTTQPIIAHKHNGKEGKRKTVKKRQKKEKKEKRKRKRKRTPTESIVLFTIAPLRPTFLLPPFLPRFQSDAIHLVVDLAFLQISVCGGSSSMGGQSCRSCGGTGRSSSRGGLLLPACSRLRAIPEVSRPQAFPPARFAVQGIAGRIPRPFVEQRRRRASVDSLSRLCGF